MKKLLGLSLLSSLLFAATPAMADNCYMCGSGSSDACKNYCKYSGSDTFENRKKCQAAGCKISGTSSCPTASNYKVCVASAHTRLGEMLAARPFKLPSKGG